MNNTAVNILNVPSGSLTNPLAGIDMKPAVKTRSYEGRLSSIVHGGDSSRWERQFNSSGQLLPKGEYGWDIRPIDREHMNAAITRLKDLLEDRFAGQDTYTVTEVFNRPDTPGKTHAVHFCERYLLSGGRLDMLWKVGSVVLPLRVVASLLRPENIEDVSLVCEVLCDSWLDDKAVQSLVGLAFDYHGRGAEIASLIADRGITDASTISSLLKNMSGIESAITSGVL